MRLRPGLPLAILVVLVVAVPILELWLLFQVGQRIGVWPTLAILVVEAVLGGLLMRHEGNRAWRALVDAFGTGRVPTGELADAALVLCGGLLLMLPGFLTDVVGFLLLLPLTRPAARRLAAFFIARRISRSGPAGAPPRSAGVVIEGETVPEAPGGGGTVISGEIADDQGPVRP